VTKKIFRLLKWMSHQSGRVSVKNLRKHLKTDDLTQTSIYYLEKFEYIAGELESADLMNGSYIYNFYYVSEKGAEYIEERTREARRFGLSIGISAIATVIALIAL